MTVISIVSAACHLVGGFLLAIAYWYLFTTVADRYYDRSNNWQIIVQRAIISIVRIVFMASILAYVLHQKTVGSILMIGSLSATMLLLLYRRIRS